MTVRFRDKMIEEMETRGLDLKTQKAYTDSMTRFLRFYGRPPATAAVPDIKRYQRHLITERGLAPNSVNRHLSGIRFFYRYVVSRRWYLDELPRLKVPKRIPTVLSEEEVAAMIDRTHKVLWKAIIMMMYSSGLRNAEVRALKAHDIDSKRMVIHVRNGKGKRDREALLSPLTLRCLKTYWRLYRRRSNVVSDYLFVPTKNSHSGELKKKFSHTALGYIIRRAAKAADIKKNVTPHVMRHSFAVHLLERGTHYRHIQCLLGHEDIRSTMLYLHVASIRRIPVKSPLDGLFSELTKNLEKK